MSESRRSPEQSGQDWFDDLPPDSQEGSQPISDQEADRMEKGRKIELLKQKRETRQQTETPEPAVEQPPAETESPPAEQAQATEAETAPPMEADAEQEADVEPGADLAVPVTEEEPTNPDSARAWGTLGQRFQSLAGKEGGASEAEQSRLLQDIAEQVAWDRYGTAEPLGKRVIQGRESPIDLWRDWTDFRKGFQTHLANGNFEGIRQMVEANLEKKVPALKEVQRIDRPPSELAEMKRAIKEHEIQAQERELAPLAERLEQPISPEEESQVRQMVEDRFRATALTVLRGDTKLSRQLLDLGVALPESKGTGLIAQAEKHAVDRLVASSFDKINLFRQHVANGETRKAMELVQSLTYDKLPSMVKAAGAEKDRRDRAEAAGAERPGQPQAKVIPIGRSRQGRSAKKAQSDRSVWYKPWTWRRAA